jgi:hypothetical membrane protein
MRWPHIRSSALELFRAAFNRLLGVAMKTDQSKTRFLAATLSAGVAVPFLYFGAQLAAAPFYPGYSFMSHTASELGSDESRLPTIFNIGAILTGLATLVAAAGFPPALQRLNANWVLAWLTGIALVSGGVASVNAGWFPMPHPRHDSGWLGIGLFLTPVLLPATLWTQRSAVALKTYLVASVLLIAVLFPFMSGGAGVDIHGYRGLLQRLFALAVFPPIGVVSFFLASRIHREST